MRDNRNCDGKIMKITNIQGLLNDLDMFNATRELTNYEITERFLDERCSTYNLIKLRADIEDNFVTFDDGLGDLIENDTRILYQFLESSVLEVQDFYNCEVGKEDYSTYFSIILFRNGTSVEIKGNVETKNSVYIVEED